MTQEELVGHSLTGAQFAGRVRDGFQSFLSSETVVPLCSITIHSNPDPMTHTCIELMPSALRKLNRGVALL